MIERLRGHSLHAGTVAISRAAPGPRPDRTVKAIPVLLRMTNGAYICALNAPRASGNRLECMYELELRDTGRDEQTRSSRAGRACVLDCPED